MTTLAAIALAAVFLGLVAWWTYRDYIRPYRGVRYCSCHSRKQHWDPGALFRPRDAEIRRLFGHWRHP